MGYHVNELRTAYPGLGRRADYANSKAAAIRLFCLDCQGGSRSAVTDCSARHCPLWPFRGSGSVERQPGDVPKLEEYQQLTEGRGNGEALAAFRAGRDAEPATAEDDAGEEVDE
jgi:hypothetical protein